MLWTLAPVLHNAFTPLYTSPFRPDPRPLHGVLLGVHAFLPIEGMYEELQARDHPAIRGSGFEERRRRVRERNAQAMRDARDARAADGDRARRAGRNRRWNTHYSSATVLLHWMNKDAEAMSIHQHVRRAAQKIIRRFERPDHACRGAVLARADRLDSQRTRDAEAVGPTGRARNSALCR
jgi:hypothetical protein